jgi:hypothetical protein
VDDLAHNVMALILGADMDVDVSIETHMTYDNPLILTKKLERNLFKIWAKLQDHVLEIKNLRTKFK